MSFTSKYIYIYIYVAQLLVHNALSNTQPDQVVGLVNSASQLHCLSPIAIIIMIAIQLPAAVPVLCK